MAVITSEQNSYLNRLKKLYNRNQRKKQGKFILEGKRIIAEALKAKADIEVVFMTTDFARSDFACQLEQKLGNRVIIKYVEEDLLRKLADTVNPQGIIAIVNESIYDYKDFFADSYCILVLDRLQDPGNMGTLIRTAVAAGVDGIIALKGCVDIYNLKVLRATMGAIFNIPILTGLSLSNFKKIREQAEEFNLITTSLSGDDYYFQLTYDSPFMLVVGNEAHGIREELIAYSDMSIKIPLIGKIESLNAAMAGGIILYDYVRQKLEIN